MKQFKFLVLTDHSGHSDQNSLYAIMRELAVHPACDSLVLASRGVEANKYFFNGDVARPLQCISLVKDFAFNITGDQYNQTAEYHVRDFDIILMRLPRPIPDVFLENLATHYSGKCIVNDPLGILRTSTKQFLLNFQAFCPPMKLCYSVEDVKSFASRFDIVLKPLKEYGGKGLLKLSGDVINDGVSDFKADTYLSDMEEYLSEHGMLAMKFLKNVTKGDKRLLVVEGQVLASSLRVPASDSWLCNVAQGGTSVMSEPDADELVLVDHIHKVMHEHGVLIYGVDTLVGDDGKRIPSEINTMSIGGFMQAQEQTGQPVIKIMLDKIIKYAGERSNA